MISDYQPNLSFFREGADRFKTVLQGGTPDRVPVAAQMHGFSMKEKGANAKDFYTNANLFVPAVLQTMEKYGIEIPFLDIDVYTIEAEALGQKVLFDDNNGPELDPHERLLKDKENLKHIKTPNFKTDGRIANVAAMYRLFRKMTGVSPVMRFTAPFSLAANLRDVAPLLMDFYNDPEWLKQLFTVLTEKVLAPYLLYLKEQVPNDYPGHVLGGADAMASPPILSPAMLEEWVLPYFLRLRDLAGPDVYLPNWWGDRYFDKPEDMFDLKRKVCPAFLEVQDPDVEVIGPEICKDYATRNKIPLVIGLGSAFISAAKPTEVFERVRYYTEVGGKNGAFYLYLCNLSATTPQENVIAAIEAARRYGTYTS